MTGITLSVLALLLMAQGGAEVALDVAVYRVEVPLARVPELDGEALAGHAATTAQFADRLRVLGSPELVWETTAAVLADGAAAQVSFPSEAALPPPRGPNEVRVVPRRLDGHGSVAFSARLADGTGRSRIEGEARIDVHVSTRQVVTLGNGVSAPIYDHALQVYRGAAAPGQAIVLISLNAAGADQRAPATALITRLVWQRR